MGVVATAQTEPHTLRRRPLENGESSVFDRELGGRATAAAYGVQTRRLSIAGRDYAHEPSCIACFRATGDGGAPPTPAKKESAKAAAKREQARRDELARNLARGGPAPPLRGCVVTARRESRRKRVSLNFAGEP